MVAVGYTIANAPGPALFVMPSLDMARSFSENRLRPLIEDNLSAHKTDRQYDLKKTEFILDRMTVYLQGANPNQLSSRPVRYLFLDEVDNYPDYSTTSDTGDLISLAVERTKAYRDHKVVITSTPTVPSAPVWGWYLGGDQRRFYVPCPTCGAGFPLVWELVKYPETDDLEEIRRSTWVECPHCGQAIPEQAKKKLVAAGEWIAENPAAPREHRSYQLSELYSPLTSWGDLAVKRMRAMAEAEKGILGPLHNFINSSLAEPWEVRGEATQPSRFLELQDDRPRGVVPSEGVLGLTAGVDTQDNGFWYVVRAWGRDLESWLIREGFVDGFDALQSVLFGSAYESVTNQAFGVQLAFIDSQGHRTAEVYDFCRMHRQTRPIKGERAMEAPTKVKTIDAYPGTNKPIPGGVQLVRLNTTYFKDLLFTKIQVNPADAGAFHLHGEIDEQYINQMSAEYRNEKGYWELIRRRNNHIWDSEVYALAAAEFAGMRFRKDSPDPPARGSHQDPVPRRKSGWIPRKPGWTRR